MAESEETTLWTFSTVEKDKGKEDREQSICNTSISSSYFATTWSSSSTETRDLRTKHSFRTRTVKEERNSVVSTNLLSQSDRRCQPCHTPLDAGEHMTHNMVVNNSSHSEASNEENGEEDRNESDLENQSNSDNWDSEDYELIDDTESNSGLVKGEDENPEDEQEVEGEDEDVEVSEMERKLKETLGLIFRMCLASLLLLGIFDFFFSPAWLHGYVWSLNQNYTRSDIAEESEGLLQGYHALLLPKGFRVFFIGLSVLVIFFFLKCLKIETLKIWELLKLSLLVGAFVGLNRCAQEKHKLYPTLHEAVFVYLGFFSVSFVILVRRGAKRMKIRQVEVAVEGKLNVLSAEASESLQQEQDAAESEELHDYHQNEQNKKEL